MTPYRDGNPVFCQLCWGCAATENGVSVKASASGIAYDRIREYHKRLFAACSLVSLEMDSYTGTHFMGGDDPANDGGYSLQRREEETSAIAR